MGKAELKLGIDQQLLELAEAAGVEFEQALEDGVRRALSRTEWSLVASARRKALDPEGGQARADQWAKDNAEAIKARNERIAERGVFGDSVRRW
jgi:post-segregation antitoxin (ccd killing protein)